MLKTYSSSSSLVITSRWFAKNRLVVPASVRLVYSSAVEQYTLEIWIKGILIIKLLLFAIITICKHGVLMVSHDASQISGQCQIST